MTADQPSPTTTAATQDESLTEALERIATGATVSVVAGQLKMHPDTLRKRLYTDPRYPRARESQAHALAEKCGEIADEATPTNVQVAKLRTDTYKWLASKMLPATYGDRAGEGAQEIKLTVEVKRELPEAAYMALPAPEPLRIASKTPDNA